MPRIIAGDLGGRRIPSPPGRGTRPTSDRVREALFSRLGGWGVLDGARVLDLYAGTGALAFEALSRGAAHALLVELHGPSARMLRRTAAELGLGLRAEVRQGKAEQIARRLSAEAGIGGKDEDGRGPEGARAEGGRFDLVFLDPPYDLVTDTLEDLLRTLRPVLAEDAVVVIERSGRSRPLAWPEGFADDGNATYGQTVMQYGGPAGTSAGAE